LTLGAWKAADLTAITLPGPAPHAKSVHNRLLEFDNTWPILLMIPVISIKVHLGFVYALKPIHLGCL
jgi:hypothetical protein